MAEFIDKQIAAVNDFIKDLLKLDQLQLGDLLHGIREKASHFLGDWPAVVCIPDCDGKSLIQAYPQDPVESRDQCEDCPLAFLVHVRGRASGSSRSPIDDDDEVVFLNGNRCGFRIRIPARGASDEVLRELYICASRPQDKVPPSAGQREALEAFARVAAFALESALRDEQQFILHQSAQVLACEESARERSIDDLAQALAQRMRFHACTIFLRIDRTSRFSVRGSTGIESLDPKDEWVVDAAGAERDPIACIWDTCAPVACNDMSSKRWAETLPDKVNEERVQQFLGVPVFLPVAGRTVQASNAIVGIVRFRNKQDEPGNENRPIDALDLLEARFVATALGPVLTMLEGERARAERVTRMRHDMYEPINMMRNTANKYSRQGIGWIAHNPQETKQKLEDIESMCTILYAQVAAARAVSYRDVKYEFTRTRLKGEFIVKLNKLFDVECEEQGLEGVFADDFTALGDHIFVDRTMFQVAMYNLYQNAVKYSYKGHRVWVTSDVDPQWYYIRVSNWGVGIPKEDRERVFKKWYQAPNAKDRSKRGLGLGLFNVREIVEAHGGEVDVTHLTDPTTVTIRLPKWLKERSPTS